MAATVSELERHGERLAAVRTALQEGVARLAAAAQWLAANYARHPGVPGAISYHMLMLLGTVVGGWQLARAAAAACDRLAEQECGCGVLRVQDPDGAVFRRAESCRWRRLTEKALRRAARPCWRCRRTSSEPTRRPAQAPKGFSAALNIASSVRFSRISTKACGAPARMNSTSPGWTSRSSASIRRRARPSSDHVDLVFEVRPLPILGTGRQAVNRSREARAPQELKKARFRTFNAVLECLQIEDLPAVRDHRLMILKPGRRRNWGKPPRTGPTIGTARTRCGEPD